MKYYGIIFVILGFIFLGAVAYYLPMVWDIWHYVLLAVLGVCGVVDIVAGIMLIQKRRGK